MTAEVKYTPWPEDVPYIPGEGAAPARRPRPAYGETPLVGDPPRIGKRPGDPRCVDDAGICPCSFCVYERVSEYRYEEPLVMPGISDRADGEVAESGANVACDAQRLTSTQPRHPHPFVAPTVEMNTGRGCDTYGRAYAAPPRYEIIEVHRYDEGAGKYKLRSLHEMDFGEGSASSRAAPWESVEKVEPNPWLKDTVIEDPMDQHAKQLREWAGGSHSPWPTSSAD